MCVCVCVCETTYFDKRFKGGNEIESEREIIGLRIADIVKRGDKFTDTEKERVNIAIERVKHI